MSQVPEITTIDDKWEITPPPGKRLVINLSNGATLEVVGGSIKTDVVLGDPTVRSGADAANLVVSPASRYVSLTKGSAGAYTLAAPGAANVGHSMIVQAGSAYAHVLTVTGLAGGNTLTFTNVVGASVELRATSATVWSLMAGAGAVQSNV